MQISSLLFASFAVLAVAKNGDSEPTVSVATPGLSQYSNKS